MNQKKSPVYKKIASVIICIASIIIILALVYMALGAFTVWSGTLKLITDANSQLFWGSIGLAIAWGLMKTIEGFVREFARSYKIIFN